MGWDWFLTVVITKAAISHLRYHYTAEQGWKSRLFKHLAAHEPIPTRPNQNNLKRSGLVFEIAKKGKGTDDGDPTFPQRLHQPCLLNLLDGPLG